MITIFNNRLLLMIGLILSLGLIASCDKDDDDTSDAVQLLSFGPTGAKHGDTLRFIGNNLNKVTEIVFTGTNATVAQKDFKEQTSELIRVVVPTGAEQGFVTLKMPGGELVTKTKLNLDALVSVSSITAEARPGENVTITGNLLNWVTSVTFERDKVVEEFVSKTENQLVVKIPADAQTGPLVLAYAGTKPGELETEDTLKVTLPAISSLSPTPAIKHKTDLTISGTNLDLVTQVIFNGVTTPVTTFVSQTPTQIVVTVPASTTKGKVTLKVASGVTVQSSQELDVVLPAVTSLAPNPIDAEANLTITGTNLDLVTGVSFTGIANKVTTFVSQSPTQLVVKVPAGTLKGKIVLSVLNSTLTVESPQVLDIKGGLPPLADFAYAIYTDATQNGFQNWSYTVVKDFNSTANVRQGDKSIKAEYGGNGYQGITFHKDAGTGPLSADYTRLEFSVFAEPGLGGKKLTIVINGNYAGPNKQVTLVEGEWTTFSVTMADLGNPTRLDEIVLQSAGFTGTIHIDHVGLR
jgi:hypothetical protein